MRFRDGKRIRFVAGCVLPGILASWALAAWAQSDVPGRESVRGEAKAPVPILRAMRDPHNGARWIVVSDPNRPGGPGRMILAEDAGEAPTDLTAQKGPPVPVIQAGERVVVEEHTATAESYLEATAVDSGAIGSRIAVRLKIGRKVLSAVAIAPGRALLLTAPGEER
jgi:hypothetical protein